MNLSLSRRGLLSGAASAAAISAAPTAVLAEAQPTAPRVVTYTRRIGDTEVITLLDGYFLLEQGWITALEPALIEEGLTQAALDPAAAVPLPICAYLIRQGDALTLMDAGAGGSLGPTAGGLAATLAAAGVAPEAVTRIVLSHMHPDHIGGMLAGEAMAFPDATVYVSAAERAFWTDAAIAAAAPDGVKPWFELAGKVASVYGERMTTFEGEQDLGGGVSSVPMPGHTPGHTGYRVSAGDRQVLLWGDSTSLASLQFAHPDAGVIFDVDGVEAAATRRRILDMAVADRMLVAGTHMPFPGFGRVVRRGDIYAWAPEEWQLF